MIAGTATMITVERTRDYELIRRVMTNPRIYPSITDDFSASATDFQPVCDDRLIYLAAKDGQTFLGIMLFAPENGIELRVHHFFLPIAWGKPALEAVRVGIEWIWANTRYKRLFGKTPAFNRLALRFAKRVRFQVCGIDIASIQKDGRLWDQILFGMSRPGVFDHGN